MYAWSYFLKSINLSNSVWASPRLSASRGRSTLILLAESCGARSFAYARKCLVLLGFCSSQEHQRPPAEDLGWLPPLRTCYSALSGEGVPALHSVAATRLVSRHRAEFATSRACRFSILGAPKCLQNGRALHRKQFEGARGARELLEGARSCFGAVWGDARLRAVGAGVGAAQSRSRAAGVRLESCRLAARKLLDPAQS